MTRYIEEMVGQQLKRSELARQRLAESGKPCISPVITLSRRMGSGARIVARKLAEDLGWSLWDKELMDAIAEDANVSRKVAESFDEKTYSELELFARGALGDHEMSGFIYIRHLTKAVAVIAKLGNAIILGRGANFLLPEALNVRIDASDEHRIQNMMSYEDLTREQAEIRLHESDKEREAFLIQTFGKERVRAYHYDLEIWMDKFSTDDAVRIIKTALQARCAAALT